MFSKTRRGIRLLRQSLKLIQFNPKLLFFPVVGRGSYLLTGSGLALWLWYLSQHGINMTAIPHRLVLKIYLVFLIALFFCNLLATFMSAAMTVCIAEYHVGLKATLREGLSFAKTRWWTLGSWVTISVTLGVLMLFLFNTMMSFPRLKKLVNHLRWRMATYFVVPTIMYHPGNALVAIEESSRIMLDYVGKKPRINFSFSLIIDSLRLITLLPAWLAWQHHAMHIAAAIVSISAILFTIVSILNVFVLSTVRSALYQFIKTGHTPEGFVTEDLANAFRP